MPLASLRDEQSGVRLLELRVTDCDPSAGKTGLSRHLQFVNTHRGTLGKTDFLKLRRDGCQGGADCHVSMMTKSSLPQTSPPITGRFKGREDANAGTGVRRRVMPHFMYWCSWCREDRPPHNANVRCQFTVAQSTGLDQSKQSQKNITQSLHWKTHRTEHVAVALPVDPQLVDCRLHAHLLLTDDMH